MLLLATYLKVFEHRNLQQLSLGFLLYLSKIFDFLDELKPLLITIGLSSSLDYNLYYIGTIFVFEFLSTGDFTTIE